MKRLHWQKNALSLCILKKNANFAQYFDTNGK